MPQTNGEERYKPPYLCWFETDFQGNQDVQRMVPLARLMYRSLLQGAWNTKRPPYLPNEDDLLRHLADAPSVEAWQEHKATILGMFKRDGEFFYHPKALREYERARAQHEKAVRFGAEGGAKRWGKNGSRPNEKVSANTPESLRRTLEAEARL